MNRVGLTAGLITTMDQMQSNGKPAWVGKVHTKGSYWDTSCRCPADKCPADKCPSDKPPREMEGQTNGHLDG